ncbi:MAG: OmpA family protein [Bacteroidota bacterium]|nr:OmpA family protein [Bacteroidota bacterium]
MKQFLSSFLVISLVSCWMQTEAQSLKKVQRIEGIPAKVQYRAITHDPTGNLYVATSADVYMIPANSSKAQPMSAGSNIMDVDYSSDNGLIMLDKGGSIRFVNSGKTLTLEDGIEATCMDVNKSTIWVGSSNGIYTVSIDKEKTIEHYTTEDGVLLSNNIYFIHTDPFGTRWAGTDLGVVRINGKNWKLYEETQAVTAITSTAEGAWMAADQNMWLVNSYNRWFPIDAWKDLVKGRVRALSSDAKGILYIASDILVKYDPYQEKVLTMNEDSNANQFILLAQGPGKNIWMASYNGMARVIEDTTAVVVPVEPSDELAATVEVLSKPVCTGMNTGHVNAKVTGGTAPYTFKWSYEGATDRELTRLTPGLYQVTISDAQGKSAYASGIVSSSPVISIATLKEQNASDKLAKDGRVSSLVTGGTSPIEYNWSNGETTAIASALPEGTHTVRAIDANGCIATANVEVIAEKVLKTLDVATLKLGQTIRIDKLYFEADSATIEPTSFAVLAEIYTFLKDNDKVVIEVGGHTNSLPDDEYCDRLSTARAKNIALYLYDKGIPTAQISYKGYGKRQPIATNQTVDGRRRNQRVELKIVSL